MVYNKTALSDTDALQDLGHILFLIPLSVNGDFLLILKGLTLSIWAVHKNATKNWKFL